MANVTDEIMELYKALQRAAKELPPGAEISISVERDAATVSACDWDGNWREFDGADMSLPDQVLECLEWCIQQPSPNPPAKRAPKASA